MGDDDERVTRLMEFLTKKLDERAAAFTAVRADNLSSYRQHGNPDEPRVLVLLDGFESFRTEYDSGLQRAKTYAQFHRLLSEGRSVGIHFAADGRPRCGGSVIHAGRIPTAHGAEDE